MTALRQRFRRLGFLSTADSEPSGDIIPDDERYRRWTLSQLQKIEAVLSQNGYSIQQFSSILDFGCGFGRLTQFLFELVPKNLPVESI